MIIENSGMAATKIEDMAVPMRGKPGGAKQKRARQQAAEGDRARPAKRLHHMQEDHEGKAPCHGQEQIDGDLQGFHQTGPVAVAAPSLPDWRSQNQLSCALARPCQSR